MSAMVLQFRVPPRSRLALRGSEIDSARVVLDRWLHVAGSYGWFLVDKPPAGRRQPRKTLIANDEKSYTIGNHAVDNEGIYQVTPEFDGWALLSRRGELSVFATLADALTSICPAATIAA